MSPASKLGVRLSSADAEHDESGLSLGPVGPQWLKETFSLQQEAMTTALTLSAIFPHPPRVVGEEWGPDWQVHVDDFYRLLPGDHTPKWNYRSRHPSSSRESMQM